MANAYVPLPDRFHRRWLADMMVLVITAGYHEIRLRGWRRVVYRLVRRAPVMNAVGWLNCSVPGTRGRLGKLMEPWRWRQG